MTKKKFYYRIISLLMPKHIGVLDGSDWTERATFHIVRRDQISASPILSIPVDNLFPVETQDFSDCEVDEVDTEAMLSLDQPDFMKIVHMAADFARAVDNYLYGEMAQPRPDGDPDDGYEDLRNHIQLYYKGSNMGHTAEIHSYEIVFTSPLPPGGELGRMRVSWSRDEEPVLTGRAAAVFWFQVAAEH
jgi:hypothetical protein